MFDSVDLEERASAGKTLVLPNPPWGVKPPTDPNHPISPETPPTERQIGRRYLAREIAEQVVVQLDPARAAHVAQLATAQQEANQVLNDARARLATLSVGMPVDADLDILTQLEGQRAALVRHIPTLEARSKAANDALAVATAEVRSSLETLAYAGLLHQISDQLHALDDQIEALQVQRADLEQAARDAKGLLWTWGSESFYPPIATTGPTIPPPAESVVIGPPAAALPKRRGIFHK